MSMPSFEAVHSAARDLHAELWRRRRQLWADPPRVVLDILPLDLDVVATRLLGLHVERVPTIPGEVDRSPVAGLWHPARKTIVIATNFDLTVQRFTLGHEIGHHVFNHAVGTLHRDRPLDGSDRHAPRRNPLESTADMFSAALLIPTLELRNTFTNLYGGSISPDVNEHVFYHLRVPDKARIDMKTFASASRRDRSRWIAANTCVDGLVIRSLAQMFGVSVEAMAIELEDLDLVS
jgi:Zn-dependent peptidase ImmA (M78 family)